MVYMSEATWYANYEQSLSAGRCKHNLLDGLTFVFCYITYSPMS